MPERQESGKTSHNRGGNPMSEFHGGPNPPQFPNNPQQPFRLDSNVNTDSPFQPAQPPKPPKKHRTRNILLGVGAGLVVLIGAATASGDPESPTSAPSAVVTPVDNGPTPDPITTPTNKPTTTAPKPTPPPAPKPTQPTKTAPAMTASQEQAIGAAESYLDFTAFSRKGLIHQLSSDAGEGFSVADATYAVDHIKVNWNEQAAKSAKSYLEMTHFSRKGLIHQLESSAGEGFTHAQAVYGVNKAGL